MIKKIFAVILAVACVMLSVTGCSGSEKKMEDTKQTIAIIAAMESEVEILRNEIQDCVTENLAGVSLFAQCLTTRILPAGSLLLSFPQPQERNLLLC